MKIIELTQGSTEWHEFRQKHIGASEAGAILGINKWKSPLQVWEEKVFGWAEPMNANMQRGVELEPLARTAFELEMGIKVEPMVAECEKLPFLSASFDGMSKDRQTIVEIKCGKVAHKLAMNGDIADYYRCQLQHQMYIADLEMIFFYSFDGKEGITIIEERDDKFIKMMLDKYLHFWNCVTNLTPPEANNESVNII
jgi:putative phage-type endonuclease